jgi:hypothetical protein
MKNTSGYSSITIGEERIDLFFGLHADAYWFTSIRNDVDNKVMLPNGDVTPLGIGVLVYGGYLNMCESELKKPKYSIGHFTRHMDLCNIDEQAAEELKNVVEDWKNSQFSMRSASLLEDGEKDDNLKKKSSKNTRLNTLKQ